ncbi:uncharacterized protein TNCV_409841 [Trichonephila clavipes]|nr:uncharacterized protein TNCV_409841 [Trichonephila clavipes]
MIYHRIILEPHTAYRIPAGTNYIVLTVQKTAFGLDIIPKYLFSQLIQKGFHVGDFRKMKKFDQTPYKLPPPTSIHVPAEKRPLEEKSLPKKRVRIIPVMRRVSRRPELPRAPMQIPHVLEPVQIPLVPEPVLILLVPQSPVQSSVSHVSEPPVQIPVSHVLEPPVQIPQVPQSTVQIPLSQFPQPPMQILLELDTLNPLESKNAFDQLMSFVFRPKNSGCFTRSHALHATGGRVRDLVDVVGRLGNALRREPTLACSVPNLGNGFGNTCGTLASERVCPCDGSDHGESCRAQLHTPRNAIHEHERLRLVHAPLTKCTVEYLPFCVRGKVSQMGREGLMVVKGTEQQKISLELVAMSLETLPEFNAIYDEIFPNSLHEDVSYCTILPIFQLTAAV